MRHCEEVKGKFVQLRFKGSPWLLLASKDQHAFHNQILAHFLTEQQIPHNWRSPEVLNFDYPQLEVIGGGKFLLDWGRNEMVLSDNSMVYGRFDETLLRESIAQVGMPWAGLKFEIR